MSELSIGYKFTPREWQKEVFTKQKRFTVLAVHRRAGKTTVSINELVLKALDSSKIGMYAYIAPELKQAKIVAWKALKDEVQQFKNIRNGKSVTDLVEIRESELEVRFWNGSSIRLFGADNPDSIRGAKLLGAVIDEVAQMPKELWNEVVYPALMDMRGFALFIGTPKGMNLFSELYYKGLDAQFSKEWVSLKFDCYQTKVLSLEDIESYKADVPDEVFKREMLCDFTASGNNQLISLSEVKASLERQYDSNLLGNKSKLILGVDIARYGADRSVLFFRQGLVCREPIVIKGVDLVTLSRIIKRYVDEHQPDEINVDGTGVGGGVVDMLNSIGVYCNDINFGHNSYDKQFKNTRTEMWCKMAHWIKNGGILPQYVGLAEELTMPTYDVNEQNQKVLESKRQIKERLGKSPDIADALALTFAMDNSDLNEDEDPLSQILNTQYPCFMQRINNMSPFDKFKNQIRQSNLEKSNTFYRGF